MKPTDESKKEVCPVSHNYQYQRGSPKKSWKADLCTASGTRRVKNKCLSKYLVTLIIPLASDRQSKVSSHREAREPPQAVQNHLPQKKIVQNRGKKRLMQISWTNHYCPEHRLEWVKETAIKKCPSWKQCVQKQQKKFLNDAGREKFSPAEVDCAQKVKGSLKAKWRRLSRNKLVLKFLNLTAGTHTVFETKNA